MDASDIKLVERLELVQRYLNAHGVPAFNDDLEDAIDRIQLAGVDVAALAKEVGQLREMIDVLEHQIGRLKEAAAMAVRYWEDRYKAEYTDNQRLREKVWHLENPATGNETDQ